MYGSMGVCSRVDYSSRNSRSRNNSSSSKSGRGVSGKARETQHIAFSALPDPEAVFPPPSPPRATITLPLARSSKPRRTTPADRERRMPHVQEARRGGRERLGPSSHGPSRYIIFL